MRIAVTFRNGRLGGGIETYLDWLISALHCAGHEVAFLFERDDPVANAKITVPAGAASFCVAELGLERAVAGLRRWQPDLVFNNGLFHIELESELLGGFNAVYYSHGYHGACISGHKAFAFPAAEPCHKPFGGNCLLYYYPRRCGGLNPLTMLSLYSTEMHRLSLLRRYKTVVTNSDYVRSEYLQLGVRADSVRTLHPFVYRTAGGAPPRDAGDDYGPDALRQAQPGASQLLFVGRMMPQKGVKLLLDALPRAAGLLGRQLHLILAGDGPGVAEFRSQAARIQNACQQVRVEFPGWLDQRRLTAVMRKSDLLIVPSWWPEPFGLVGLEAGTHRLPAVAFAAGGIPEWLIEGVNGSLASADPPTAIGLSDAIARCLRDPVEHEKLRAGAFTVAHGYSAKRHLETLLDIFAEAIL